MEILLLHILATRDRYNRFKKFIKEHTLTPEIYIIVKDLNDYYDKTGKTEIDWPVFKTWFLAVKHATFKADKVSLFTKIFDNIIASPAPEEDDVNIIVQSFIQRDHATRIAEHTLRIAEGEDLDLSQVESMMQEWEKESGRAAKFESLLENTDLEELFDKTLVSGGFNWRLPELNKSLGPLRKGDFIVIGSPAEVGKTTMIASESSFMATQMKDEQVVLWFNNEEGEQKVRSRCVNAALGWTNLEIMDDPKQAKKLFLDSMGGKDRLKIFKSNDMDIHDIDSVIKQFDPGLIIIDQLWKCHGFTKEAGHNEVMRQTMLFNQGREWAKQYAPVIAVHQADGTAGGVPYIEMAQLYMSRVGIQGEADAIIMIGKSYDTSIPENTRYLHIPKNKLSGGPLSDPKYRHAKYEIEIDPERARYKGFV